MLKKNLAWVIVGFLIVALFPSGLFAQYRAEDIAVPPGYKVIKVAETNKIYEPYRLSLDSDGNLIIAGFGYLFYKMDWGGQPEVIAKTRKYDINPVEVERSPEGFYVVRNLFIPGTPSIYTFTPPGAFVKVLEAIAINAIGYDKQGRFYAALREAIPGSTPVQYRWVVNRYNAQFQAVEAAYTTNVGIQDFAFDSQNNLCILVPGLSGDSSGVIIKVFAGGDGIPGPSDLIATVADQLNWPNNIAVDDTDDLYTDELLRTETDGLSQKYIFGLTRVSASGAIGRNLGPQFNSSQGLICHDGFLYVSEFFPAVISKVDLATFQKTNVTQDFGISAAGPLAFDARDALYAADFRQGKLMRLNPAGRFDQVGAGIGNAQSIASDGSSFYIGSAPHTEEPSQILKIDPVTEARTVVASGVRGFRTVVFDSYQRLILNTVINEAQNQFGAEIIDTIKGTSTPYLIGLHNKGRCIRFDDRQNIYFVEGNGSGIKKVALHPSYTPPRDLGGEPLFYDFVIPGFASPTIYFFAVNPQEEVFVPRMDSGDLLFCDPAGNVERFAQGFILPTQATIDRFGALYVSDAGNGVFKIVHERWTIPAVIKLEDKLLKEIRVSPIDSGVRNSLVKKLENAGKDLEKGQVIPAINKIEAFVNEVEAQSGKNIPAKIAAEWIQAARAIINALREIA